MFQGIYSKLTASSSSEQQAEDGSDRKPIPNAKTVSLNQNLLNKIRQLAANEDKTAEEMVHELLDVAVHERQMADAWLKVWESLTPREKQTASLTCLGYTNEQIALEMVISTNTVKTHVKKVLSRFNVNSKEGLRQLLADWDFTEWVKQELKVKQLNNSQV